MQHPAAYGVGIRGVTWFFTSHQHFALNILPQLQVEETLSTLSYATRTKNIHNRPMVQYDPREAQISLLRREIELLRQENTLLKEQLRIGAGTGGAHAWDEAGACIVFSKRT